MKQIIGTLAYTCAVAVVILATLYGDVDWYLTAVALMMLVIGALWAWTDPKPETSPCDCPRCDKPRPATADDVR